MLILDDIYFPKVSALLTLPYCCTLSNNLMKSRESARKPRCFISVESGTQQLRPPKLPNTSALQVMLGWREVSPLSLHSLPGCKSESILAP